MASRAAKQTPTLAFTSANRPASAVIPRARPSTASSSSHKSSIVRQEVLRAHGVESVSAPKRASQDAWICLNEQTTPLAQNKTCAQQVTKHAQPVQLPSQPAAVATESKRASETSKIVASFIRGVLQGPPVRSRAAILTERRNSLGNSQEAEHTAVGRLQQPAALPSPPPSSKMQEKGAAIARAIAESRTPVTPNPRLSVAPTGHYACTSCRTPLFPAHSRHAVGGLYDHYTSHYAPSLSSRVVIVGGGNAKSTAMSGMGEASIVMCCSVCGCVIGSADVTEEHGTTCLRVARSTLLHVSQPPPPGFAEQEVEITFDGETDEEAAAAARQRAWGTRRAQRTPTETSSSEEPSDAEGEEENTLVPVHSKFRK